MSDLLPSTVAARAKADRRFDGGDPVTAFPTGNRLLDALLPERQRIFSTELRAVRVERDEPTQTAGTRMRYADFPIDAVLCTSLNLSDGGRCDVETVGREGYVEIDAGLDTENASRHSRCRIPGVVLRVKVAAFRAEMQASERFSVLVHRNIAARFFSVGQYVACGSLHTIVQRSARWLLQCNDAVGRARFPITQDVVAEAIGAQRPNVTVALGRLREAEAIELARGVVTIADRLRLEAETCECYADVKAAMNDALMTAPPAPSS